MSCSLSQGIRGSETSGVLMQKKLIKTKLHANALVFVFRWKEISTGFRGTSNKTNFSFLFFNSNFTLTKVNKTMDAYKNVQIYPNAISTCWCKTQNYS